MSPAVHQRKADCLFYEISEPPQKPLHLRPRFRRACAARLRRSTPLRSAQNDTDGWQSAKLSLPPPVGEVARESVTERVVEARRCTVGEMGRVVEGADLRCESGAFFAFLRDTQGACTAGRGTVCGGRSLRRWGMRSVGLAHAPSVSRSLDSSLSEGALKSRRMGAASSEIPPRVRGAAPPFDSATLRSE